MRAREPQTHNLGGLTLLMADTLKRYPTPEGELREVVRELNEIQNKVFDLAMNFNYLAGSYEIPYKLTIKCEENDRESTNRSHQD